MKNKKQMLMQLFRDKDVFSELTPDDCNEIFLSSLKGSSDITKELLCELLLNYGGQFDFAIVNKSTLESCHGYIKDAGDEELLKEIESLYD